jgi:YHS domain-containing protein
MRVAVRVAAATLLAAAFAVRGEAQQSAGPAEALDGVDTVVLIQSGKEVQGKPEFKVVRGKFEYLFSTAATKAAFEKTPERFEIQLGGACARMGARASGNPSDYLVHDGKIYIFGSDDCHKKFAAAPEKYLARPAAPMPASPASTQAGRALIDRAVTAVGGAARLDAVSSYVESSSQIVKRPDGDMPVTTKTTWRFPGAVRVDTTMTRQGKTMASATLVTPAGAWFLGQGRAYPMNAEGREAVEEELNHQLVAVLRSRKDPGVVVAALGPATIDGARAEQVRIRRGAVDVTLGLEAATGQVRSLSFTGRNGDGEVGDYVLVLADYRNVDGLMLPFSIKALFNGTPDAQLTRTVDAIAVNAPVDPKLFEPGSAGGQ